MMDKVDEIKRETDELTQQLTAIQDYNQKKEELEREKGNLGIYRNIADLPYPKQVISVILVIFAVGFALSQWPTVVYGLLSNVNWNLPTLTNYFMASLGLNALLILVLMMIMRHASGVVMPFLKARGKKPVIAMITKNQTLEFKVPKEVRDYMWDVDEHRAVMPDSTAQYRGPNHSVVMPCIPEFPVGLNIRELLAGKVTAIDMASVKQYAEEHALRATKEAKSGYENLKPFVGPLIILVVLGLIFGPQASKFLDQNNKISDLTTENIKLRQQLANAGMTPFDMGAASLKEEQSKEDVTIIKPASTGGGVSGG